MGTPYHPIRSSPKAPWTFPGDLKEPVVSPCRAIYSLLLKDGASSFIVNGWECVGLAHGIQDPSEEVVYHPFFGSDRVRQSLQDLHGWAKGHVTFRSGCALRDPSSGLVCEFDASREVVKREAL